MLYELISTGFQNELTFIFFIYGISFVGLFFVIYRSLRKSGNVVLNRVFWILGGFGLAKGFSIWADAVHFIVGNMANIYGMTAHSVSVILAVIANVFVLQFSVALMTHRLPHRKTYEVFPLILFVVYLFLYVAGVVDADDAQNIGRYTFGYNGGILACVALAHFYQLQQKAGNKIVLRGIVGLILGFAMYAIFDGILSKPILNVPIYVFRMISAMFMVGSILLLRDLFIEKSSKRVDYV